MRSLLLPCFVKPASCVLMTSVSRYYPCVFQACLSFAVLLLCFKHVCLLLSFLFVASASVSCYFFVCFKRICLLLSFLCVTSMFVSCYLSCVFQACLSLAIRKAGQPTLPSCMHTAVSAPFASLVTRNATSPRSALHFLTHIKPGTMLTLYNLPFEHGAHDCLSV